MPSHRVLVFCVLAATLASPGCVRRRMTIRSNPAGATVYVDDQQVGTTPVSTSYTYYGTRKIQLVKDGYETLTVKQNFRTPWYQIPPLDFFSENLIPYEFRDERIVEFEMNPQPVVPAEELRARANQLRQSTMAGYAVPTPPAGQAPSNPFAPADTPATSGNPDASVPPPFYP